MLRAVIFDMDGTLLDSEVIHYIVINNITKRELGWNQTPEEYLKYCGVPDQKMWPMMLDELDGSTVMSLARKWEMLPPEAQEIPQVEIVQSEATEQNAMHKETSEQNATRKEALEQNAMHKETLEQNATRKEASEQNAMGKEALEQNVTRKEASEQNVMGKETSEQNAMGKETPEQNVMGKEAPGQEVPDGVKAALSAELERLHWAEYDEYIERNGVKAFPGVRELMEELRDENIRIAVATGSLVRIVRKNLKLLNIEEFVEEIATSEDCENGKPAPDVFLLAAKKLGVDPSECLVVEDAGNGLQGAISAGMACAGFDGSELPSDMSLAPVVFSDYRLVKPKDMREWHRLTMGRC